MNDLRLYYDHMVVGTVIVCLTLWLVMEIARCRTEKYSVADFVLGYAELLPLLFMMIFLVWITHKVRADLGRLPDLRVTSSPREKAQ